MQAYLIMALNYTSYGLACDDRQFEWLRYAAWGAVAPLTVSILGNTAGASWSNVAYTGTTALMAVVALFAGANSPTCVAAWPLLAFAIGAGLVSARQLLSDFASSAKQFAHGRFYSVFILCTAFQVFLWIGYAVVWGVSEGGKAASATQEIIAYTVLDILSKSAFSFLVYATRDMVVRHGTIAAGCQGIALDIELTKD
jgi:bacteriorhodopsin